MTFRQLLYIALLCLSAAFGAAGVDMRFKQIGLEQGLSHATVNAIAQDARGYIWIATPDGLNRYDGSTFRTFRHREGDARTPATNAMRRLTLDAEGNMWAAAPKWLVRYDATTERFTNYAYTGDGDITDIICVAPDTIMVGTNKGIYTFTEGDGFVPAVRAASFSGNVRGLAAAPDGDIYIAAGVDGLYRLSASGIKNLPLPGKPYVHAVLADGPDGVLVATEGAGLISYDTATGKAYSFRAGGPEGLGSDYVRSLAHDGQGRLWVGTFNGLAILDKERRHFTLYDTTPDGAESLSHSSVRCIYADNQGGLWLGTFFGGVNYYHPLRSQFATLRSSLAHPSLNDNVVGAMAEDNGGRLWIATNNGGVNLYDPAKGTFQYFTKANGLGSNDVKAIYLDTDADRAYIGSHLGGLNTIDIRTGAVGTIRGVASNVFDIKPAARPGSLWIATLDHLLLYDTATGKVEEHPTAGLRRITDLYRDGLGYLWISGEDGIAVFGEGDDGRLTRVHIDGLPAPGTVVNNVHRSAGANAWWIATDRGLYRIDGENATTRVYTTEQGLPNDIVYGVLEDAAGNAWCSTNGGIAVIDAADGTIRTYSARDGLQSNQFNPKSFLAGNNGTFYFGGIGGLTSFDPVRLQTNPTSPTPLPAGLRLYGREVVPGDDSGLLDRALAETPVLTFAPDQSVFTIDFTVCNFVAGDHNTFAYKLEGIDKNWNTVDGAGSVTYSKLPAGKYRFVLRAANNDGVWSDADAAIDIVVLQVWYKRWWALALFALVALGVIAMIIRYLWRRRAQREALRLERIDRDRQRELNEMKVRFFINMSHELRTPLTLILLPLQELLSRATDLKTTQKLTIVKNNAERILHIVNQLLDYRRAEMGMFKLAVEPLKINDFCRKIFANYNYQAQRHDITYTFDSSLPADIAVDCDPQYVELICNNLLTNAFKYTARGQSINLTLEYGGTAQRPTLLIKVADTGCGIPAEKLSDIFTRFYQVSDRAGGSGIGLSLVKRLVELHHGAIAVYSELGKGTTFTVELPIGLDEYSAEERASDPGKAVVSDPIALGVLDTPEADGISDIASDIASDTLSDISGNGAGDAEHARPTILVADDSADILKYICESLSADYNVRPAANGAKALEILAAENIDVIITDIMMPDIDGMQLCRTVKRNLRTSHIPVIMLSAKGDVAEQLDGLKVGADDYIAKPFSMAVLAAKIKNLLRTRHQAMRHFTGHADVIDPEKAAINPLDEEFLKKAMKVMEEHLDDSEFSTDTFAREMCMSRSNLHLKMKALTGESTNDFTRRYRMRKALELLKTGRYTVSEVSGMVGYGTPSYFATSFRKFYGKLPSEYVRKD